MTTDELTRMLVQIVNNSAPEELAAQIAKLTPLSPEQAAELAKAIATHGALQREVAALEAAGLGVEVPSELAGG